MYSWSISSLVADGVTGLIVGSRLPFCGFYSSEWNIACGGILLLPRDTHISTDCRSMPPLILRLTWPIAMWCWQGQTQPREIGGGGLGECFPFHTFTHRQCSRTQSSTRHRRAMCCGFLKVPLHGESSPWDTTEASGAESHQDQQPNLRIWTARPLSSEGSHHIKTSNEMSSFVSHDWKEIQRIKAKGWS